MNKRDNGSPYPPYLRHRGTGDIYPWNDHLAERDDMEPLLIPPAFKVSGRAHLFAKDGVEYVVLTTRTARDGRPLTLIPANPELLEVLDGVMNFVYASSGGKPTVELYAKFGLTL